MLGKIQEEMLVWPGKLDIGYDSRKKKERSEKGMLVHLPPAMCQALCYLILNTTLGLRIVAACKRLMRGPMSLRGG